MADKQEKVNSKKILIVDDLDDLLDLYITLFTELNISAVKTCTSTKAGIAALKASTFDLIITDLAQGGKLIGQELITAAQKIQPKTPIVVASGNVLASEIIERIGGLHKLEKPFKTEEFYNLICPLLGLPLPAGYSRQ